MIELAVIYVYIFLCNHNPEFSKNNCTHVYFREFLASELVQPLSDARADPDNVLQCSSLEKDQPILISLQVAFPNQTTCTSSPNIVIKAMQRICKLEGKHIIIVKNVIYLQILFSFHTRSKE